MSAGLSEGADVQVGGVHSGMVQSINLPHKPGDKVTVVMNLDKSTHEIIKQDSVASIETEGMLGNQYAVAISFGSAGQGEITDSQVIQSQLAAADGRYAQERPAAFWIAAKRPSAMRPRQLGAFELGKRQD